MAKTPKPAGTALFVEGTLELTQGRRSDLKELWTYLAARVGGEIAPLEVHGFTKQQLVLLDPKTSITVAGKIPLDVHIHLKHAASAFRRLVIAFDALPANQAVLDFGRPSCLASERDFLLSGLARSEVLAPRFKQAAGALLAHYKGNRARPRTRTRPPLGDVEVIYMDPSFEALLMTDAAAIRRLFSLERAPNAWPKMPFRGTHPEFELAKLIDAHRLAGPPHLHQRFRERKHAWAQEIVRHASATSPLFRHDIAVRLGFLLPPSAP